MAFKKITGYLLTFAIIISIFSLHVFAEAESNGKCGENLEWVIDNGTLIISGYGDMYDFGSSNYSPWYNKRGLINYIVIENGVTNIGENAFYDCTKLYKISIPNSVNEIKNAAFCYCSNLLEINIPNSVKTIGVMSFYYCSSLTEMIIPDSVTMIKPDAFNNCKNLSIIELGDGIPYFSFTGISNQSGSGLCNLKEVRVKSTNKYFKAVNGVLFNKNMTDILFYPAGKTEPEYAVPSGIKRVEPFCFNQRNNLISVILPIGLQSIGNYAFNDCASLKTIKIPLSVTTIGDNAFDKTSIESINYGGSREEKAKINIGKNNNGLISSNWVYAKKSEIENSGSTEISNVIIGNPKNRTITLNYRSTITFYSNVKKGDTVQWYVNDKKAGNTDSLTVKEMKENYTIKINVTSSDGTKTTDTENVRIKTSFFDKFIAFFVLLFDSEAYTYEQVE